VIQTTQATHFYVTFVPKREKYFIRRTIIKPTISLHQIQAHINTNANDSSLVENNISAIYVTFLIDVRHR